MNYLIIAMVLWLILLTVGVFFLLGVVQLNAKSVTSALSVVYEKLFNEQSE